MISYEPLWKTMKNRHITTYFLINKKGFSPNIITSLRNNKSITIYTLERLCQILDCTPNDIIEFVPDENINEINTDMGK